METGSVLKKTPLHFQEETMTDYIEAVAASVTHKPAMFYDWQEWEW
jgi:hypothetical protein